MDEKTLDAFTSFKSQETIGATIESMFFTHGEYDWVLLFTAPGIVQAKRFCETLLAAFPRVFQRVNLMETLVAVRDHHIVNPNVKKLKEFL